MFPQIAMLSDPASPVRIRAPVYGRREAATALLAFLQVGLHTLRRVH